VIPQSTVVANAHDRQQCNVFGDVERLSKMDTSLAGKGAPSEPFAHSLQWVQNFRVANIKGSDSQVITETWRHELEFKVLFSQVVR
jgi:hypothetical protein